MNQDMVFSGIQFRAIKRHASHLQDDIKSLIRQFEQDTGVAVSGVICLPNKDDIDVDIEISLLQAK